MKTLILYLTIFLTLSVGLVQAKTLSVDTVNAGVGSGTVNGNAKQTTFVFSSPFSGTINGVAYDWAAGGSLTVNAYQGGDLLDKITYTVTTGTLHIIRVQ